MNTISQSQRIPCWLFECFPLATFITDRYYYITVIFADDYADDNVYDYHR